MLVVKLFGEITMTIIVDEELREICRDLLAEGWSESEWAEREADDWVQTSQYEGGYEDGAFCFSRYTDDGELWFEFTLAEARAVADGSLTQLSARPAE
jgi:hypothetical protein